MDELLSHWPFVVTALCLATVGQAVKQTLWTKDNAAAFTVCWWGYKTKAAHPVIVGALLGVIPGMPVSPGVAEGSATVLYYAGAGIASTWGFALLKGFAKKRGYDLAMPGDTTPPH